MNFCFLEMIVRSTNEEPLWLSGAYLSVNPPKSTVPRFAEEQAILKSRIEYDALDRVVKETKPHAVNDKRRIVQRREYDGLVTRIFDAKGQLSWTLSDLRGKMTLAVDAILPMAPVLDCIAEFDDLGQKTALRLRTEVLAGAWEVLLSGDADLVIGATGESPPGGGYRTRELGTMEFVFCVSPTHPLANARAPLTENDMLPHRVVAISDTARKLPLRSAGVLQRQARLAVPDLATKLLAQQKGLGIGNMPRWLFESAVASGLVEKDVVGGKRTDPLYLAWRSGDSGRALAWFIQRLSRADVFEGVLDAV